MKTVFEFDSVTGDLIGYVANNGNCSLHHQERCRIPHHRSVRVRVDEGEAAEREFFTYFGDVGWPTGWWVRITAGRITKRTWQNYFGVHCPDREPFKIDPEKYRRDYS